MLSLIKNIYNALQTDDSSDILLFRYGPGLKTKKKSKPGKISQ